MFFKSKDQAKNANHKSTYKIQSFTYFIPSPNQFNQAYREKHFDKVFYEFINQGFEILSVNTQSCNQGDRSGMWILLIVRATNQTANNLNISDFFGDSVTNNPPDSNDSEFEIIPE